MSDDEDEYEYEYDDDDSGGGGNDDNDGMDKDQGGNDNNNNETNDFEYTDEEEYHDDSVVVLENAYYNAKGLLHVDLVQADLAFVNVIQQEQTMLERARSSNSSAVATGTNNNDTTTTTTKMYGPWSFKSMKQLVKLNLRVSLSSSSYSGGKNYSTSTTTTSNRNNNDDPNIVGTPARILKHYKNLLECVSTGDVSPAAVEKGINGMLERVALAYGRMGNTSTSSNNTTNFPTTMGNSIDNNNDHDMNTTSTKTNSNNEMDQTTTTSTVFTSPQSLALAVYDATLTVFHPIHGVIKNDRVWFKTSLKYGQLLYEMNETIKLEQVLKELIMIHNNNYNNSTTPVDGSSTTNNTTMIASSSSSMSTSSSNNSTNLIEIYALQIQLLSRQKDYKELRETDQRAMNVIGEIPHPRTIALIHELFGKIYMLSKEYENASKTFFEAFQSYDEAGDTSRFRCLKYFVLASLLSASSINPFDSQEARTYIKQFESVVKQSSTKQYMLKDVFICLYIHNLFRTIRTQVLNRIIRPHRCMSLHAIAYELNDISIYDVEQLLIHQVLQGQLQHANIDPMKKVLHVLPETGFGSKNYTTKNIRNLKSCLKKKTLEDSFLSENQNDAQPQLEGIVNISQTMSVRFDKVFLHHHLIHLGDNPSVSIGPPLTIDWTSFKDVETSVDHYEEYKPQPRNEEEMMIPLRVREFMLIQAGFTRTELASASRKAQQVKKSRIYSAKDGQFKDRCQKLFVKLSSCLTCFCFFDEAIQSIVNVKRLFFIKANNKNGKVNFAPSVKKKDDLKMLQ